MSHLTQHLAHAHPKKQKKPTHHIMSPIIINDFENIIFSCTPDLLLGSVKC